MCVCAPLTHLYNMCHLQCKCIHTHRETAICVLMAVVASEYLNIMPDITHPHPHMHTPTPTHAHTHTHTHPRTHTPTHTCTPTHTHPHVCTPTHPPTCMHTRMHSPSFTVCSMLPLDQPVAVDIVSITNTCYRLPGEGRGGRWRELQNYTHTSVPCLDSCQVAVYNYTPYTLV